MSTEMQLSPEPAAGPVFVEQLRAVGLAIRREAFVFVLLLIGQGFLLSRMLSRPGVIGEFDFQPDAVIGFMVLAAIAPLFVWKAENPERRTYFWSVPVSRRSGQLLKLASGWLWTMVGVGFIVLWGWVMAMLTGGLVWKRELTIEPTNLAPGAPFEITGGVGFYQYQLPAWLLLMPFALATILYLVGSAVVLSTNHALRWAAVLFFVAVGVSILAQAEKFSERAELQRSLGRQPTYNELLELADEDRPLERLLGHQAPYGLGNLIDAEPPVREVIPGTIRALSVRRANLSNWLSATALWGGLAFLAAFVAASRHRDP